MEYIDLTRDIAAQVKFYEHIATFGIGEADAQEDDENAKGFYANGCGDCLSLEIHGPGDEMASITVTRDDARKLGEFLIATANL